MQTAPWISISTTRVRLSVHSPTLQLIGGSIFLFRINRNLAFVTVLGIFFIGALTTLHGEFIRRMGRRSQVSHRRDEPTPCPVLKTAPRLTHSCRISPPCTALAQNLGRTGPRQQRGQPDPVPHPRRALPRQRGEGAAAVRPWRWICFTCLLGILRDPIRTLGSQATHSARYGVELRNTVNMLETHDLGHSIYRSVVRLLQTCLQVGTDCYLGNVAAAACRRPASTHMPSPTH